MPARAPDPVDLVFYTPSADLADPVACGPTSRRNPTRKRTPLIDEESLRLYGGHESFLVRTALVRSDAYKKNAALAPVVGSSRDIFPLLRHLACSDVEYLVVLAADSRMRLIAIHEAAKGSATSAHAEMRDIVKIPLLTGASSVAIAHNHPSGDPSPSADDVEFTRAAKSALGCVGVQLLDHLIIADRGTFSFLDSGMMHTVRENPIGAWW